MSSYKTKNRRKYLLQYHLILVCKYRKKLLSDTQMSNDIKILSQKNCDKHGINVKYMETDIDHIHYMIEINTILSISYVITLYPV